MHGQSPIAIKRGGEMFPNRKLAIQELKIAGEKNPGLWTAHSYYVADAKGFCILEKRFIDTARRYGFYPFSLDRWNNTYKFKEYFEERMGKSIYTVLPEIEKCIYT